MQVLNKPYSVDWIRAKKKSDEKYILDILISGNDISEDIRIEVRQIAIENKERNFRCILTENGLMASSSQVIDSDKDKKAAVFSFLISKDDFDSINDSTTVSFIVQNISVQKRAVYLEKATMEKGTMKEIKTFIWNPKKRAEELEQKKMKKKTLHL